MDVVVIGRHFDVPDDVRDVAGKKAGRLSRYLPMDRAEVCFSRSPVGHLGDPITCEIVLDGRGRTVRVAGTGARPLDAFDDALEKARLQLSRMKGKLVARSRPRHGEGRGAEELAGSIEPDEDLIGVDLIGVESGADAEGIVDPEL